MQIEFDQEEYIEQMKILEQLKGLQEEKIKLEQKKYLKKIPASLKKDELQKLKENLKKYNIFSRISTKKRKEISQIKKAINEREKKLEAENEIINNINEQIDRLQRQIEELEKSKKEISIPSSIKADGSLITITDESTIPTKEDARDDYVMVHCTDFFPKDRKILCNYDGKKTGEAVITYNGVSKKCKALSHRHSCHFTLNNVVRSTADGAGSWSQPKFVIIDPLDNKKNNFINIGTSDSWTYGSAILSERPIMLVREDVYDEIPKNQFHNYNIIKYSGNYEKCVRNAIRLFGYKIRETETNDPGHSNSIEMKMETNLNDRNLCLNYIFDNTYNGVDTILLSDEEMVNFFEVLKQKRPHIALYYEYYYKSISKLSGIPVDFVRLIVDTGIIKYNGKYSFKNDNEMYFDARNKKNIFDNIFKDKHNEEEYLQYILENIDIKGMQDIYKTYTSTKKKDVDNPNKRDIIYNEIKNLTVSELCKYENHEKALAVVQRINEIITKRQLSVENPEISSDGIKIKLLLSSESFDKGKIIENGYKVEETGLNNDYNFYLTINLKEKKIIDMLQELDNYLENLYSYSKSKSSFEQAQAEFESLTEEERKKMIEDQRMQEEFQQSSSHTR